MNQINRLINVLNRADIFPNSEELADTLWLALQMENLTTQEKTVINEKKIDPNKEEKIESDPPLENKKPPETPENNSPQSISTESKEQPKKSSLYPHKQNSGGINSGLKGQAFRTPALPALHNALAFNRALRPLRKKIESRFHNELDIEKTVQNIAETNLFLPVLKGKPEHWLELVIVIDNAISMQIWKPLLDEFCRLLELQGTFKKIYFYQLDTENKEVKILNKNKRLIKNKEIIKLHQPRLIWLLSDCVSKAWHTNEKGVFQLLQHWSRFHPVSIIQMLPYRLWKGTSLGYAEEARFFATLSMGLNRHLTLKEQDFWFFEEDELKNLKKGFKIPILTLEPEIINSWVKLVLGKKDHWLKGVVFENQTTLISPLETDQPQKNIEITAEQRIKQFRSFASPTAQTLAAYLACVPLDLSVMNVVQKLMLPESQQIHLAEVFLGGLLKREKNEGWVEYEFHEGVRDLLLDTVILADAVYILTRVSDFVEKHIGKSLDFLALLANPHLTEGIELNEKTRPFAEIGAKILRRLGGKYENLADKLEEKEVKQPVLRSREMNIDKSKKSSKDKIKIIMIEPNKDWQLLFKKLFKDNEDVSIVTVNNMEELLPYLENFGDYIDVVSTEITLYRNNSTYAREGLNILNHIATNYPHIIKVIITGTIEDFSKQRVADLVFSKSHFNKNELLESILTIVKNKKNQRAPKNISFEKEKIDFILLTNISEEFKAVSECFGLNNQTILKGFPFLTHYLELETNNNKKYKIIFAQSGIGQVRTAITTTILCGQYNPQYILLVGVCAGRRGVVGLNDIIITNEIIDGSEGEIKREKRKVRWHTYRSNHQLFQESGIFSTQYEYKRFANIPNIGKVEIITKIHHKPLFSLNNVIKNENLISEYAEVWTKAAGVEMEGAGVFTAISEYINPTPKFMMIRGISDFAGENKEAENKEPRIAACRASAHYIYVFLKSGPL